MRLTVAQATIRFLANQYVERDGERTKFFAGCFGIFGHGNVAGIGQALLQAEIDENEPKLRYVLGRNEQAMVHSAAAYARQKDRLEAWVVTASIGPGSTNMLTGAALATINRLPVLLLPSDTFATRVSAPVLQDLEQPHDNELTVNDAFKPLSRFFDRVWRPEQLPSALLGAMRVLTDPVETGAATIALPQDVQAEAFDWPESLFAERTWHIARPVPERSVIARAAEVIRSARRPLIVAGGGVIYSGANDALVAFVEKTGIPVSETQAGKGSLRYDHPQAVGAIGSTGTTAANALAAEADVVIGIGTRYSDFTSAIPDGVQRPRRAQLEARHSDHRRPRRQLDQAPSSPVWPERAEESERAFFRSMEELLPIFEREGIDVRIDPHPDDFVEDGLEALRVIRGLNSPNVGMVYVACHSYHMGGNMSEIIRAAGNRLRLVHVADTMDHHRSHGLRYITNPPGNPARVHQHLKIGDGDVDWDEFFGGLAEIDFYDRPDTVMVSSVFAENENAHDVSRYQLATMSEYVSKYRK